MSCTRRQSRAVSSGDGDQPVTLAGDCILIRKKKERATRVRVEVLLPDRAWLRIAAPSRCNAAWRAKRASRVVGLLKGWPAFGQGKLLLRGTREVPLVAYALLSSGATKTGGETRGAG